MKKFFTVLLVGLLISSCLETPNNFEKLPPGKWRVILKLSDPDAIDTKNITLEEDKAIIDYFKLPFNLDVVYTSDQNMDVYVLNGNEKILIENVGYGRDPRTAKDTIQFDFTSFDTKLQGFYEDNLMEGYWKVPYRGDNYQVPFIAYYGQSHRFDIPQEDHVYDFSGKWKVVFEHDTKDAYPAIGEFVQDKNHLTGTFLTETGDYRYLEGNAYGQKLKLSVFDGAHAFLFAGNVSNDTIYGDFRSGNHYKCNWIATRDENYQLTDPYNMTKEVSGAPVGFNFKNTDGDYINLDDEKYTGKYKLINIMGTWCPNCKDEIKFLKEVRKEFPEVQIFSLAFERYREEVKAMTVLKKYKKQLSFDWPLLLGGYADKNETSETFGFLDKIYSYPTLLLIDDKNKIIDIHTGFNGPATTKYEAFKESFYSKLKQLNIK